MKLEEHLTAIKLVIFLCDIRTFKDGCNINEQIKVDLVFVHSITDSIAHFPEYFHKHDTYFVPTVVICNKGYFTFLKYFNIWYVKEVTQLKMSIVSYIDVSL